MLGWLAVAAAPLIIHLWNKRKFKQTDWAAMKFLLAAVRQNARRLQLRQWLLLLVRTAIIVCLVLAAAEPFLQRAGLNFIAGQRTHKILVIDASYSMDYRPTDRSRFARAKQLASRIVEESSQGDGFSLVLMADPPRTIINTPAFEAAEVIKEIEAQRLTHSGANLLATIGAVRELLEKTEREHAGLDRAEAFFLTDLGRDTWQPQISAADTQRLRELTTATAELAELVVIDLGQTGCENVALTELTQTQPYLTTGAIATFEVAVRNFGQQLQSRQTARLLIDGAAVRDAYFDIQAGATSTVSFSHRFDSPGRHVVEVVLGDDLLAADNRRWLSTEVESQLNVLCVRGSPDAARYIAAALAPDVSAAATVAARVEPETALLELDLAQFDCIFLSNVAQFTRDEAQVLRNYLAQGGGVVFFLGDRVMADRYNQELAGDPDAKRRVLPARLGKIAAEAEYRFDPLGYRHPIVAPFRGQEEAGLLNTSVFRYYKLDKPEEFPSARVALAFSGGDPAIVEEPLYGGRSILVATAGSLASVDSLTQMPWTTMPAMPSFVPIVQELLAAAVGSRNEPFNARVGDALGGTLSPALAGEPLEVQLPDQSVQPVRSGVGADAPQWSFDSTPTSGVYHLRTKGATTIDEPYAVNLRPLESDLEKADPEELSEVLNVQS
ncbi:MAG: BatA domain-containing protein, partial [Planctomycetales bacterium]|nr:BatA domain-containing protein [Planctomycetales bacterium]